MKLSKQQSVATLLLTLGSIQFSNAQQQNQLIRNRLIDKCCQIGKEKAIEDQKFNCKLSAKEALLSQQTNNGRSNNLLALSNESLLLLSRDSSFSDQCEMILESCCLAYHRNKNCDSGKQFAKSGSSCMDVELSKEVTIATESFNDCCMSCSLGILAARNPSQNETINQNNLMNNNNQHQHHQQHQSRILIHNNNNDLASRCKLLSPLESSLSGQLYEQTYIECCQENLPKISGSLIEPGTQIDCLQSNPCSQRCLPANGGGFFSSEIKKSTSGDRCDCFSGYKLASDGISCSDIDECKLNLHTCNKKTEICDNIRGSFRCLARETTLISSEFNNYENNNHQEESSSIDRLDSNEFNSLRLCPIGFKWNQQENRCQQQQQLQALSSVESPIVSTNQQKRSASLVYASRESNNNNNNNYNQPLVGRMGWS